MQFVPPTIAASAAPRVNLVNCSEFGARDVVLIFDRGALTNIQPPFKDDADVVLPSPHQSTFCNCKKAVERNVELYRKQTQPLSMDLGVCPANAVSSNAQFSALKE
jgi:hypothetical protein